MEYHGVTFLTSAIKPAEWPNTSEVEIVFAGRSNAGKSSLINALVNRKNIAYKGKTPGKTRTLNFYLVDNHFVFTDAPGYGYAKGGMNTAEFFGRMMEPYFKMRSQLKGLILVCDIRRIPSEDDIRMIEYAKDAHLNIFVAATKCDKVSNNVIAVNKKKIVETLGISQNSLILTSSLKRTGMDELWNRIESLIEKPTS